MAGVEDIVGKTGNYNVRDKFKRFDNKFIRPHILKNIQVCINKHSYILPMGSSNIDHTLE